MEQINKINAFIAKYGYGINKEDMPAITFTWKNSKEEELSLTVNENCNNGELITMRANSICIIGYMKYDKDLDVLAFGLARLNSSRVEPETREWIPVGQERYYVVDHVKAIYDKHGNPQNMLRCEVWNCKYGKYFNTNYKYFREESYKKTMKEFLGEYFLEAGTRVRETNICHFDTWIKRKKDYVKMDKKSEAIIANELPELDTSNHVEEKTKWITNISCRINAIKDYDVIRLYLKDNEYGRIFVNKKDFIPFIKLNNDNKWHKVSSLRNSSWAYQIIIIDPNEIEKTQYLKTIKDCNAIFRKSSSYYIPEMFFSEIVINNLNGLIKNKTINLLYNAGYKNIVERILGGDSNLFGNINKKANSLYKRLGVNAFQLKDLENSNVFNNKTAEERYTMINIRLIKQLLKCDNISFLDNDTYLILKHFVVGIYQVAYDRMEDVINYYINNNETQRKDKVIIFAKKIEKFTKNNLGVYQTIYDIYNTRANLFRITGAEQPTFDLAELKDYNDLIRLHDTLVTRYVTENEIRRQNYEKSECERKQNMLKSFKKKLPDQQKQFNYEDDGYVLKVPEDPYIELQIEGTYLHHCVSGYADRVLNGNTNIIFLRKKIASDRPFMTIEVCENVIKQCHGSYNAWIGSSEEYQKALPTVIKWMHEKKLKCDKKILTSKSTGYGCDSRKGFIELPQVDFNIKEILI